MFFLLDHPLAAHRMATLRATTTSCADFRAIVSDLGQMLCYEAARDLPTEAVPVTTPVGKTTGKKLAAPAPVLVPILRAGLGMVEGVLSLLPEASVGHIGMARNEETLEPMEYYCRLPEDVQDRPVFVLDPMLATGGSAVAAIDQLKKRGVQKIRFLCIVSAPQGVERLRKAHPDVDIYTAALDEDLNEHGYIVPGLGDAGDRIFGTPV